MKTMNANGIIRVNIIEFFVDSPRDMIESESSYDVIDGRYNVVVKFIFAVTLVAWDWKTYGLLTRMWISSFTSLDEMDTGLVKFKNMSIW